MRLSAHQTMFDVKGQTAMNQKAEWYSFRRKLRGNGFNQLRFDDTTGTDQCTATK